MNEYFFKLENSAEAIGRKKDLQVQQPASVEDVT